jgi:hypothetical protein
MFDHDADMPIPTDCDLWIAPRPDAADYYEAGQFYLKEIAGMLNLMYCVGWDGSRWNFKVLHEVSCPDEWKVA